MKRPMWRVADMRLVLVGTFFVLAWIGIGYRLFMVQGVQAAEFAQRGFDQRVRHETIPPDRGTIFDRDGVELAVSLPSTETLVADPAQIEDGPEVAALLAPITGADFIDLAATLDGEDRFAYVARRLESAQADEVRRVIDANELPGLTLIREPKRVYPAESLAAHVIGLTRLDDNTGLEGLELLLNDVLVGKEGQLIVERDPGGRAIPQGEYLVEPATPGADIVLTLDREIQFATQAELEAAVERTGSVGGAAVVLDPHTGEVLAMASAPGFDPNERDDLDPEVVKNRAVTEVYEPGSTLKAIAIAAALEEKIVEPGTTIEVHDTIQIGPEEYSDHSDLPSVMTVADIVAQSSNVGTIRIQQRLGNELQYGYLDAFGLGRAASIDFAGEQSGTLEHVSRWCHSSCGPSAAIGYGVGVTPLQMAAVYATIANDGEWVEPHVVAEIIEADGTRIETDPRRRTVLSPATSETMRRLLRGVVERGTGYRAALDGYTVGGKTGTSNKFLVEEGRYSDEVSIASFIGLAPVEDPRVVVAVVLDSPRGELEDGTELKFGGASAAPVFAAITEATLHQLGVSPTAEEGVGDG
jgi:cell division protein FtsI (penicillin-binding protein 3)